MITIIIQINNRIYKQKLKKHDNKVLIVIERQIEQKEQQTSEYYKNYKLQLINLNLIIKHSEHTSKRQF